jgi:hypothetical protein
MTKNIRGVLIAGMVAVGMLPALRLSGQDLSWSFSGEAAGDKTYVLFGQPTLLFGPSQGLRPFVNAGAHVVWSDNGAGSTTSWGVTPAAGLRWQDTGGFIEGERGWAFAGDQNKFDPFGGGKSGFYTGAHVEYWGSGAYALQGIANYNWGAKFLWSRAQALARVAQNSSGGATSLGARLTWEAQTDSKILSANRYQATYLGPVLQFSSAKMTTGLSAGWKHNHPTVVGRKTNTWYVSADLYLP